MLEKARLNFVFYFKILTQLSVFIVDYTKGCVLNFKTELHLCLIGNIVSNLCFSSKAAEEEQKKKQLEASREQGFTGTEIHEAKTEGIVLNRLQVDNFPLHLAFFARCLWMTEKMLSLLNVDCLFFNRFIKNSKYCKAEISERNI